MNVDAFLQRLDRVRRVGKGWSAKCPAHDDGQNSLSVSEGEDGRLLFKCFAGCTTAQIVSALGLKMADLFQEGHKQHEPGFQAGNKTGQCRKFPTLSEYAKFVNLPENFLVETFSLKEGSEGIEIPFIDATGEVIGVQWRHRLEKSRRSDRRFSWKAGKTYLYGAWAIPRWRENHRDRVLLCEGASDTHVCWLNQIPALGIPGASAFKKDWASLLLPFRLIATIQEPGEAGDKFVKSIANALKEAGYQGQVKAVTLPEKDPRDLWLKHGERFKEELEAAIAEAPAIDLYPKIPPTSELILKIAELLNRHIFFRDKRYAVVIAVWTLGTYVYDIFTFYGYLWMNSPTIRCGKSRVLDVLKHLCCRATPGRVTNPTESSIFRLAALRYTLMLDELDNLRREDKERYGAVMAVLNNGFEKDGVVVKSEKVDGKWEPTFYNVYCPKALAGITQLTDTIKDRCLRILMVRKTKEEKVMRFNPRKQRSELESLRNEMQLWAEARRSDIEILYDGIEDVKELAPLDDRFQDITEPLVAIVSYADAEAANGGRRILPELISLLLQMAGQRTDHEAQESIGAFVALAWEILGVRETEFIASGDLLVKVKDHEGLSWIDSTKMLANFLSGFDLAPGRKPGGKVRGYKITREWVQEVRNRYASLIPDSEASQASQVQSGRGSEGNL